MSIEATIQRKLDELNAQHAEVRTRSSALSAEVQALNNQLTRLNTERMQIRSKIEVLEELIPEAKSGDQESSKSAKKPSLKKQTEEFYRSQQGEFSVDDVRKALGISVADGHGIRVALADAAKTGELERVRTGVYRFLPTAPSKEEQNGAVRFNANIFDEGGREVHRQ